MENYPKEHQAVSSWFLRRSRLERKAIENASKPPLTSGDVLETADFVFSPYKSEREGDSGKLLLAKRKENRSEQYVVKHAYMDCACNEYIYYHIAKALGVPVPETKLFRISDGEKRKCFKTEFVVGTRNIPNAEHISGKDVPPCKIDEYIGMKAMETITSECDGIEVIKDENGNIFRIDTTAAFGVSCVNPFLPIEYVGAHIDADNCGNEEDKTRLVKLKEVQTKFEEQFVLSADEVSYERFSNNSLKTIGKEFGGKGVNIYLSYFKKFTELDLSVFDEPIRVLGYFYTDCIAEYFGRHLKAIQKACADYLQNVNRAV